MRPPSLKNSFATVAGTIVCLGGLVACGAVYPELGTPLRAPSSTTEPVPPPPDDVSFLYVASATVPTRTLDGRVWDSTGGAAPDPYAIVFIDDVELLRTPVASDTTRPKWPGQIKANYRIPGSAQVRVELWDDNTLNPHPICAERVHDLLDARTYGEIEVSCASGATVTLAITNARARLGTGLYYELRNEAIVVSRVIALSAAARAGIRPGEQILTIQGRPVQKMVAGEAQSLINSNSRTGLEFKLRAANGSERSVQLREEALYPLFGEGIPVE